MGVLGSIGIGVDFAGAEARFVEARRRGGGFRYRTLAGGAAPRDAALSAALPAYAGFVRRLHAPIESLAKARRVFPSLLDIELPFPIETCAYAFLHVARCAGGGVEALAVAARNEDVASHLSRLAEAGLDPQTLDHEAVILWDQCAREQPMAREHHRLIVYLGAAHTTLVVGSGERLLAATGLRQSSTDYLAPAAASARARVEARLTGWWRDQRERAEAATWHVVWCGPLAEDRELRREMSALLALGDETKAIVPREAALLLARGLAAQALVRRSLDGNLRAGALAHPDLARLEQRRARGRALALAASAALLVAVNAGWRYAIEQQRAEWQRRLVATAQLLAGSDRLPRGQELLAAQRAIERDAPGWAAFRAFLEPGGDRLARRVVQWAHQSGVDIQHLAAQPAALLVQGSAEEWTAGERLAMAMQQEGWRTALERREAGADERVHFTLRGER